MTNDVSNHYIRVPARLDEDAIATHKGDGFQVTLRLRIARRTEDTKASYTFEYKCARPEDVKELLAALRKDKSVEVLAKLGGPDRLVAEYVRIERMDFELEGTPQLLPPAP